MVQDSCDIDICIISNRKTQKILNYIKNFHCCKAADRIVFLAHEKFTFWRNTFSTGQ